MPQDLNKGFEKEKIDLEVGSDLEGSDIEVEKFDKIREIEFEKESSSMEKTGEEKKDLEKSGEAVTLKKKTSISMVGPEIERQKQIDQILSEGLNDVFLSMNSSQQKRFKEEGEETVKKISELLSQAKIKLGKIISLIKKWLKLIPKVNHYFLEQEAKIKADKIIKLKK